MSTFLGALTTTFTPAPACFSTDVFYRNYNTAEVRLYDGPECYPSQFTQSGYYSPGLYCPSGYKGQSSNDGLETSVTCCPTSFELYNDTPNQCRSIAQSDFSAYVTAAGSPTATQFYTNPESSAALWAYPIHLRYKSSDFVTATSTSSVSAATTSASNSQTTLTSTATSSTSSTTSTSVAQPSSSEGGMSTGTKIAVGVVVPTGVLALLGAFLLVFLRRKKAQRATEGSKTQEHSELYGSEVSQTYGQRQTVDKKIVPSELEARDLYEK